jgi:PadR family transcriptional regulator PadR
MGESVGEFEQFILFALLRLGDRAYGVTIRKEIESRTGRTVSSGAIYTALDRLESRGYVSSLMGEPTPERGGRRKKFYRLEPLGVKTLGRSYSALMKMAQGLEPKLTTF